jgi:hypothetical protein
VKAFDWLDRLALEDVLYYVNIQMPIKCAVLGSDQYFDLTPFANVSALAACSIITTAPPPEVLSSDQVYLTRRIVKMAAPCGGHFTPLCTRLPSVRPCLANTHLRPAPI